MGTVAAGGLRTALEGAADVLAGGGRDAEAAAGLARLAASLEPSRSDLSQTTRSRFAALAATLEDLAERLR